MEWRLVERRWGMMCEYGKKFVSGLLHKGGASAD